MIKWAIPKKLDSDFFVVPAADPRTQGAKDDPAFGDFNSPIDDDKERDDDCQPTNASDEPCK